MRASKRLVAVALTCLAIGLAGARPADGAELGVVSDVTWGTSPAVVDRTVVEMRRAGVRFARMNASWSWLEPTGAGELDGRALAQLDYAVERVREAGIGVLMPISHGVPYWASGDPSRRSDAGGNHWNIHWRPREPAAYSAFVGRLVERYAPRGVHAYEVWSEPNLERFWPSGPDARDYVALLRPAARAIRAADPRSTVVLGGLSGNDHRFLGRLYRAGARPYFDVAAVHPYTGAVDPTLCWRQPQTRELARDAFCAIRQVRATMVANGDARKRIWLTEFGWSTYDGPYGVSEARQAELLGKALVKIDSAPFVERAFYYGFRNVAWLRDDRSDIEANFGLLRTDFSPKPALAAYRSHAARQRVSTSRCHTGQRRARARGRRESRRGSPRCRRRAPAHRRPGRRRRGAHGLARAGARPRRRTSTCAGSPGSRTCRAPAYASAPAARLAANPAPATRSSVARATR